MSIIKELQDFIRDRGITENQLAKESGVAQQIINRFMADKMGMSLKTADKLCTYLQLQLRKAT